jgi:hypothetical protein
LNAGPKAARGGEERERCGVERKVKGIKSTDDDKAD